MGKYTINGGIFPFKSIFESPMWVKQCHFYQPMTRNGKDITYKNGDIEDCLWPIWLCFSHITRSMVTACANFNSDLPTCPSTFGCLRTAVNRQIRQDKHQGDGRQDLPNSKHNFSDIRNDMSTIIYLYNVVPQL